MREKTWAMLAKQFFFSLPFSLYFLKQWHFYCFIDLAETPYVMCHIMFCHTELENIRFVQYLFSCLHEETKTIEYYCAQFFINFFKFFKSRFIIWGKRVFATIMTKTHHISFFILQFSIFLTQPYLDWASLSPSYPDLL